MWGTVGTTLRALLRPSPRRGMIRSTTPVWVLFSSRRRHTRFDCDWSSDVCSSDLCSHCFGEMGEEVRQVVASLGYERAQDLVGRSDLLVQSRAKDAIDLTEMIRPLEEMLRSEERRVGKECRSRWSPYP